MCLHIENFSFFTFVRSFLALTATSKYQTLNKSIYFYIDSLVVC